jgi:aryl sulfotransferase
MVSTLPQVTHVYQNHLLDSTRWEQYKPRDNDIVISTSLKSGTTWMQMIVTNLVLGPTEAASVFEISPWIEARIFMSIEDEIRILEAQTHRRFVKTHLPLDGLPYFPQVKYIVVGRDARDVFMSLWNHYSNTIPEMYQHLNSLSGRVGDPFPQCPEDIREFWREWITRGWFEWESEGFPYWSNMWHTQSWWNYRHLPNILFVHYGDLLKDTEGEILRIAAFLDIEVPREQLPAILKAISFASMKENADKIIPMAERIWEGGGRTFINKGTNRRWTEVLTAEDLEMYSAAVDRILSPDCAAWLENGRLAGHESNSGSTEVKRPE